MSGRRYIICATARSGSAGSRALYVLRDELERHGCEALLYIFDRGSRRDREEDKQIRQLDANTRAEDVVVYPESVWGNPLGFRRVARWLLNSPGMLGGPTAFPPSDGLFAWTSRYCEGVPCLRVDVIDRQLFCGTNVTRDTDAVFVYKGGKVRATPEFDGLPEITMSYPKTRLELAKLLQRTKTLYTHDANSSLLVEALACGAQVKVITKEGISDYVMPDPLFDRELFERQIRDFIEITQNMPGGDVNKVSLALRKVFRPFSFMLLCVFVLLRRYHPAPWVMRHWAYFFQCVYLHA